MSKERRTIAPQEGPQSAFLASPADIAIYGGAAGAGKTYALLLEPLRHVANSKFGAVLFRREMPQITKEGGPWDTARELFAPFGATFTESPNYRARFKSGAKIEFHHLQLERSVSAWDGSQIPLVLFDELQHFTEAQFFYMLSRNRTTCGVRPYVRATCNPSPDSWLRRFLSWWIDDDTGFPIQERANRVRYFVRVDNVVRWADTAEELREEFKAEKSVPKSVAFIPATLADNRILTDANPEYESNLRAMLRHERDRLLFGNWNARAAAGTLFRRSDFEIVDPPPPDILRKTIRGWDRAATEASAESPDPDWTAGVKIGVDYTGVFYIMDCERFRARPFDVQRRMKAVASQDGRATAIGFEKDPGAAGVAEADTLVRMLAGYDVTPVLPSGAKVVRWRPFAVQAQAGNVKLVRGDWNRAYLDELEAATDNPREYAHDDQIDATSVAFNLLAGDAGKATIARVNVY